MLFVLMQMLQKDNESMLPNATETVYRLANISFYSCLLVWLFLCFTMAFEYADKVIFLLTYTFFCLLLIWLMYSFSKRVKALSDMTS